jgi:HAD superfamily hydrolase (TIGR01459 family)
MRGHLVAGTGQVKRARIAFAGGSFHHAAKRKEDGMTATITRLDEISSRYRAIFCDLWGCLHDGRAVLPPAASALQRYRSGGGRVVLLTNAARPWTEIEKQLASLGVPRDCWDLIVSSGDATQRAVASGTWGSRVHFIGPERDLSFFRFPDGRDLPVTRTDLDDAELILCTGLTDDRNQTPDDYREVLLRARARGLPFLCANPDVVVDVGTTRIWCAGALAEAYARDGGAVHFFGKPHPPIYLIARERLAALSGGVEEAGILCIGDGMTTDIAGGMGEDLDTLFISGGLAARETGTRDGRPDPALLQAWLSRQHYAPTFVAGALV